MYSRQTTDVEGWMIFKKNQDINSLVCYHAINFFLNTHLGTL